MSSLCNISNPSPIAEVASSALYFMTFIIGKYFHVYTRCSNESKVELLYCLFTGPGAVENGKSCENDNVKMVRAKHLQYCFSNNYIMLAKILILSHETTENANGLRSFSETFLDTGVCRIEAFNQVIAYVM